MNRESERKRLVELLDIIIQPGEKTLGDIADHLLDNGIVVPPVKVGDVVYYINSWLNKEHWKVYEGKISGIQQKADKTWKFRLSYHLGVCDHRIDAIGKTVFLTREEAEKALEGKGE